jgi:bacteriocin-like protein
VNECERCVNKGLFCCRLFLSVRIYGCKRNTANANRKENKPAGQKEKEEEMKMNTSMKELNINELEQVNGGGMIHEKTNIINDVINLNPIGAIKKWYNTSEARTNNQLAIYKAAVANGFEEKNIYPFP